MNTTRQRPRLRQGSLPLGVRKRVDASIRRMRLPSTKFVGLGAMGLRVGFVGARGFVRIGGAVDSFIVHPDGVGSLAAQAGPKLDLLLVDAAPQGFEPAAVTALIAEAHALGARVVGLREGEHLAVWAGAIDLELDLGPAIQPGPGVASGLQLGPQPPPDRGVAADRLSLPAPVDPREINPIEFKWTTEKRLAAVGALDRAVPEEDEAYRRLGEASAWAEVDLFRTSGPLPQALPDGVREVGELDLDPRVRRERLRPYRGVVDHAGLHASAHEHVSRIVELSAAGVPVVLGQLAAAKQELLGDRLATALEQTSLDTLEDGGERERASVAARRAALREHSLEGAWRRIAEAAEAPVPPRRTVSVVLATNRPTYLEHAAAQVNHQSYEARELVVVLHGDRFPSDVEERLERLVEGQLTMVRASPAATLGDALNAGTRAASGELITKMDDDDWYGPDHLWDLVLAMEYSGAELVAKGAEFVYLEPLDLTMRRFIGGAERPSETIGGGTFMLSRRNLEALGGWRPVPAGVDRRLLADLLRAGGQAFRTHGYGYLYRRHGAQTWAKDIDYFLSMSREQWRGLDLDAAAVEWPASARGGNSGPAQIPRPWEGGIPARRRTSIAPGARAARPPAAPSTLSELRLAMLVGQAHRGHIAHVCDAVDARTGGWRALLESSPPHLLLIESSWLQGYPQHVDPAAPPPALPAQVKRTHEMLAWCEDRGVPTALWETAPWSAIVTPLALMEGARHLFCADPDAVPRLCERLEGRRPLELPLAVQSFPSRVTGFGERAPKVAFVWPWTTGGDDGLHVERLEEIYSVAESHGVAILLDSTTGVSHVPRRLEPFVTRVDGYRGVLAALQGHRAVVPFDPRAEGEQMLPQIAVDAAAGGNVMLVPGRADVSRLWRLPAVTATTRKDAGREIPRLLLDWEAWTELSMDLRRAVHKAHRYRHRVANVASVAGYSLKP